MIEYHNTKYNGSNPWKNCPEYRAWENMNRIYGDCVCTEWRWVKYETNHNYRAFSFFLSAVGRRPNGNVLIRLDKFGAFGPGNVRWGTHSENAQKRGPMRKFSYSRDEELIAELERRGYDTSILAKDATHP